MIHLDSVEKAAKRIETYLNDPEAFGEKLNANRRERLETLYSSLSASIKLLGERLDKSDFVSESTEAIVRYTVAKTADEVVKRIISTNSIPFATGAPESFDSDAIFADDPIQTDAVQVSTNAPKKRNDHLTKKHCKLAYALYAQTLSASAAFPPDDYELRRFTDIMYNHFMLRFSGACKYNIHQISECICKMFVSFIHHNYSGSMNAFESRYDQWKRMFESGDDHYIAPAFVSCFNPETISDDEAEHIKNLWLDLIEDVYAPITRVNISDSNIREVFLLSNPFRVWETDEQKEVNTATQ